MITFKQHRRSRIIKPLAVAVACATLGAPAIAQQGGSKSSADSSLLTGDYTRMGGYVRTWGSWNLENPGNTSLVGQRNGFFGFAPSKDLTPTGRNERGSMSMARVSAFLDFENRKGTVITKASFRVDREYKTGYLERLDEARGTNSVIELNKLAGVNSKSQSLMDQYNDEQIRDLYVDFPINDRIQARLGKQQVVWGETDFFRAMDLVTGFDYRWRSFLEVENEELRKTNWMANFRINVPEKDGNLQVLIRPGLDRKKDIGNSYDITGGRWANQPYRTVDFYNSNDLEKLVGLPAVSRPLVGTNFHHRIGNIDDWTGGVRWNGLAGNLNYSLAALTTFGGNPVIVPAKAGLTPPTSSPFGTTMPGQGEATKGSLGDLVYPKLTVLGFTLNGYSNALDALLSTEQVYTHGVAYNLGSRGTFNSQGFTIVGLDGFKQKNTFSSMFRMDKTVNLQNIIGTSRPSFGSVQVFNTRILNYNPNEDLLSLIGMTGKLKEDNTIVTFILAMNYRNDRINPTIALGHDVTYGGSFFIPSVEFVFGDNWRLKAEADIFFGARSRGQAYDLGQGNAKDGGTPLLGYFRNNDQFVLRLTRQF